MVLISIFGPDGVGKSTQTRMLAKSLLDRGINVRLVWIKSYHTLAFLIYRLFVKLSPRSIIFNPDGAVIRINAICNNSIGRMIWSWIEFLSLLPVVIIRVYIPLWNGCVVIADRYIVDSIVSIAYALNEPNFASTLLAKIMLFFIPKNSLLIHLDSDYDEIERRRGGKADSQELIVFQRSMYNDISKIIGAVKINTAEENIEDTALIIRDYFNSTCK